MLCAIQHPVASRPVHLGPLAARWRGNDGRAPSRSTRNGPREGPSDRGSPKPPTGGPPPYAAFPGIAPSRPEGDRSRPIHPTIEATDGLAARIRFMARKTSTKRSGGNNGSTLV